MTLPARRNAMNAAAADENELFLQDILVPRLHYLAGALGDVNALRLALDNFNGSLDEPVEDGDTALHLACMYGYLPCARLLVERGASLDAMDEYGAIPLHVACAKGYVEIVRFLIASCSDPQRVKQLLEWVDVEGNTPLHRAARGQHADVIIVLLAAGASPTKRNSHQKTPGELAVPGTEASRILAAASSNAAVTR